MQWLLCEGVPPHIRVMATTTISTTTSHYCYFYYYFRGLVQAMYEMQGDLIHHRNLNHMGLASVLE